MYFKSIYCVLLLLLAFGACSDSDDITNVNSVWTAVAEYWDAAITADSNTALLNSSLGSISAKLTTDVYWSSTFFAIIFILFFSTVYVSSRFWSF
jgi:hypothetical protein